MDLKLMENAYMLLEIRIQETPVTKSKLSIGKIPVGFRYTLLVTWLSVTNFHLMQVLCLWAGSDALIDNTKYFPSESYICSS